MKIAKLRTRQLFILPPFALLQSIIYFGYNINLLKRTAEDSESRLYDCIGKTPVVTTYYTEDCSGSAIKTTNLSTKCTQLEDGRYAKYSCYMYVVLNIKK